MDNKIKTVEFVFIGDDDSAINIFTSHFNKFKPLFNYKITDLTCSKKEIVDSSKRVPKKGKDVDYRIYVGDTAQPDRYYKDVMSLFRSNGMFRELFSVKDDGQILLNATGKFTANILGESVIDTGDSFISKVIQVRDIFNREYEVFMDTSIIHVPPVRFTWAEAGNILYAYSKFIQSIDNEEINKNKTVPTNYREPIVSIKYGNRLSCNLDLNRQIKSTQSSIMDLIVDFVYRRINIK